MWVIYKHLEFLGTQVERRTVEQQRKKKELNIIKKIKNEFPLNCTLGLLKGFFKLCQQSFFNQSSKATKTALISTAKELAMVTQELKSISINQYTPLLTALNKDGAQCLPSKTQPLNHIAFLSLFHKEKTLQPQNKDSLFTTLKELLEIQENYLDDLLKLQSDSMLNYYENTELAIIINPVISWCKKAGIKHLFFTNPLNTSARTLALWAQKNNIQTSCFQHSGGNLLPEYPHFYTPFDTLYVPNKALIEKIRSQGFKGEIVHQPREFVNSGSLAFVPPTTKKKKKLLIISALWEQTFPISPGGINQYVDMLSIVTRAAQTSEFELWIKPHPRDDYLTFLKEFSTSHSCILLSPLHQLESILNYTDYLIHPTNSSPSTLVSLKKGVPSLVYMPLPDGDYSIKNTLSQPSIGFKDEFELKNILEQGLNKQQAEQQKKWLEQYE